MVKEEYVFKKPKTNLYKKLIIILILFLIIALTVDFAFTGFRRKNSLLNWNFTKINENSSEDSVNYQTYTLGNETFTIPTVPPEYKGTEGLDYIRENSASDLEKAKSFCTVQFKGSWNDTSNEIGCHGMQGFYTLYCNFDIIQDLANLCTKINGNFICSTTKMTCIV